MPNLSWTGRKGSEVKTSTLAFACLCCKTRNWTIISNSLQKKFVCVSGNTHILYLLLHINTEISACQLPPNKCNSRIWSVPESLCFPWKMLQKIYIHIHISLVGSSDLNLWKQNKTNWRTIQQQHLNLPGGRKKKRKKKKKIWLKKHPQPPTVAVELGFFCLKKGFLWYICSQNGDHPQNNFSPDQ